MKKINLLICLCQFLVCTLVLDTYAQLSSGGQPYSLGRQQFLQPDIPIQRTPAIDIIALQKEDALLYSSKEQPYRYGAEIPVNWSLENVGQWETIYNGDRIWRLQIDAKGAKAMNLQYDDFYLPPGAKLYLYNKDYSQRLGAFTNANNKSYNRFATSFIFDETTILEYYEPQQVVGEGRIQVSTVIHAYQTPFRDYGDSGPCNVNVNCPEGEQWSNQKRAVAMIFTNGRRHCTGAMINNTTKDCTPMMLSAKHCFGNPERDLETAMFFFNYESPSCENENGPTDQVITGANLLAGDIFSDFALLELSVSPPPDYNVYHVGWSVDTDAVTDTTFTIHHPQGDVKKISLNTQNGLTSDAGPTSYNNTHWRVSEWEIGTTERISSGCPLFNTQGLLIGQLHGGEASCDNKDYDVFGKLAFSWDNQDALVDKRIRNFLDPTNTGALSLNGRDCNVSIARLNLDASLAGIANVPTTNCGDIQIEPIVEVLNIGENTINDITIHYQINGGEQQAHMWQGSIDNWGFENITLPPLTAKIGENTLEVILHAVDGGGDEIPANDTIRTNFQVLDIAPVHLNLLTDRYAYETAIEILDLDGNIIMSEGGFDNQNSIDLSFCLLPACYEFHISDTGNDGICCSFGNGGYSLQVGQDIFTGGEFNSLESFVFCVQTDYTNPINPVISADKESTCVGDPINLSNATESAVIVTNWQLLNGVGEWMSIDNETAQIVFEEVGNYEVEMEVTNGVDTMTTTKMLTITEGFEVEIDMMHVSDTITVDGTVSIIPIGGNPPYTYEWSHSMDTSNRLTDLAAGWYEVTITDQNGCQTDTSFSLIFTSNPTHEWDGIEVATVATSQGWRIYYPFSTISKATFIEIINLNGQKIDSFRLQEGENTFRNLNLLSGIYLYQIRQGDTVLLSDRFLYVAD